MVSAYITYRYQRCALAAIYCCDGTASAASDGTIGAAWKLVLGRVGQTALQIGQAEFELVDSVAEEFELGLVR